MLGAWTFALWAAAATAGQDAGVSARASVDSARAAVGDRITLSVTVAHPAGAVVDWPAAEQLGSFEVLDPGESSAAAEGQRSSRRDYTLVTFELGALEIPGLDLVVVHPDGHRDTVTTDPVPITIESVGLEEGGDIRTIKPPLGFPRSLLQVFGWLAAGAAAVAIGWWAYRRARRRGTVKGPVGPAARRPPDELALEALSRLEASDWLERGEIKRFVSDAADIMRVYLEGRYGIEAMEMTSFDLLPLLEMVGLPESVRAAFERFFDRTDLVKFAKHRPPPDACRALVGEARGLVEQTRPAEPEAA